MNLLHLKYAIEVEKTRSISRAAENLYMRQPNLSRAIRELESTLGIVIFRRSTKGMTVTADGEEFLRRARAILAQVEEVEEEYRTDKRHVQRLSVCVPRAGYIAAAFADFICALSPDDPAEIYYKETNAARTVSYVRRENFDLGIVRYQSDYDKHFRALFEEKGLTSEPIADFLDSVIVSKHSPLADRQPTCEEDLSTYTEVVDADPYVPFVSLREVRQAEQTDGVDRTIYLYDRAARLELLSSRPDLFYRGSPLTDDQEERYGLVSLPPMQDARQYTDALIYRRGMRLSPLDTAFFTCVRQSAARVLSHSSEKLL